VVLTIEISEDSMSSTNIACAQIDCVLGDPQSNLQKIISTIRSAAERDAKLVMFPECALTGYAYKSLEEAIPFAESINGPSSQAIAEVCHETGAYAVVGFIEADQDKFYNAAMLVGPDGVIGGYRKVHLPFIGIDRFLTPGDRPFQAFQLPFGKVGMNVCYDISFPEAARVLKLMGAELIALITNWPEASWRSPEFVAKTRALENHVFFAATDRVGTERGWKFIGRSMIVDCNGDTIAQAGVEDEELLIAAIDFQKANDNHIVNVPGEYEIDRAKDRRPDLYSAITGAQPASKPARTAAAGND
jgi:predicted amidohydrolase